MPSTEQSLRQQRFDMVVKACRSGEYKFGIDMLRSADDCYCIMGVACEVAIKDGIDVKVTQTSLIPDEFDEFDEARYVGNYGYGISGSNFMPPEGVRRWLYNVPGLSRLPSPSTVMQLNDNSQSFEPALKLLAEQMEVTLEALPS